MGITRNVVTDVSAQWSNDIPGTADNDLIIHLGGAAFVNGGGGDDILSIAASANEVTTTINSEGVTYITTPYGLITAINLEKVALLDADIELSPSVGEFIVDYSRDWSDPIWGTNNNDRIIHLGGEAYVDGYEGTDSISIAAKTNEVSIEKSDEGFHLTTSFGQITLVNIERIALLDGDIELYATTTNSDTTPPTLQTTTATSNQLILSFSEDIQFAGGVLNPSFFTVTVDGRRLAVAGATINPNDPKQIILAIAGNRGRGLSGESTINVAYNPPTTPNQVGVLQGINGALLQSFTPTSPDTFTSEQSISRRGLSSNFKNLILTGSAIDAIGNDQDNTITGNDANNKLNGLAGADTMIGKGGNDTYLVDNVGDVITELANEGIDTVESIISYALGDSLENLILTDRSANVNGTGNALSNVITGNRGDNILDGNGGADTLIGDRGNDTYIVDSLDDIIIESGASRQIDSVESSVSWTLGVNLENLTLTGTSAIYATGNTLDNILIGNDAANVIDGGNGGKDILTGLGGADTFRLSAKPRRFTGAYVNRITDFSYAEGDKIEISKSAFGISASTATLSVVSSAAALTTALSTESLFVYNSANGELHWNQNGITRRAGSGGVLAILDNKATLSAGDLVLI